MSACMHPVQEGLGGGAVRGLLEDLPLICDVAEVLITYAPDMFKSYPEVEAAKVGGWGCMYVCACARAHARMQGSAR